ncbi:phospholipase C [Burkholderia sp. L27(2015)]|uniref:phospholipase C n=1 Tax=Burkholderia sp. L27(2015) TaxID=1641858 RepID=UPI00131AF3D4|nr:alkaline phosphatase family protein [Burkholderia sp. L27(2015)]
MFRRAFLPLSLTAMTLALAACGGDNNNAPPAAATPTVSPQDALNTATPIKHVVVVYGENESFDHYFATYPTASNLAGEPVFTAAAGTPTVNGLTPATPSTVPNLLNPGVGGNPNSTNAANLGIPLTAAQATPFRIDRAQANTASQNHSYTPEQKAEDNGLMDAFPVNTGKATALGAGVFGTKGMVMGYFDGNTVTALWNYAQHYAMNQNAYTGTFGPSTPGAIEVVSGQNNGVILSQAGGTAITGSQVPYSVAATNAAGTTEDGLTGTSLNQAASVVADGVGGFTMVGDLDPAQDACTILHDSATQVVGQMSASNKNIGDLLNAQNITWGGFMGGFNLSLINPNGSTSCSRSTFSSVLNATETDYVQHHAWFQYYPSTANFAHSRPTSLALVGFTDPKDSTQATAVHHQYDTEDFFAAVEAGNFPSVSFLKAPAVQDAHPGNSDPLDEQAFVTKVVNFLEQQPDWKNTAVIVAYDDSDGWYDHQFTPPTSASFDLFADQLVSAGTCSATTGTGTTQPLGVAGSAVNGRCGPGTRTPFIVISPWAKANFVDNTAITQASVTRFIEDNWLGGTRIGNGSFDASAGSIMSMFNFAGTPNTTPLFLDPTLGTALTAAPALPTAQFN